MNNSCDDFEIVDEKNYFHQEKKNKNSKKQELVEIKKKLLNFDSIKYDAQNYER